MINPIQNRFIKVILLGSMLTPAAGALAQDSSAQVLEELVIVGKRGQPQSVLDSPVPVDVISADKIESTATLGGEVGELLQNLSPSFNFPRQANSGSADTVRAGQLRGLGPDQVLVLVNGKRQHTTSVVQLEGSVGLGTAPFDFNTIGTGSIQRIEVLRDGASAQYGSDAIAGVVNVVLKEGGNTGSVSASYGAHMTTLDENNGDDVTDGQTFYIGGEYGWDIGDKGFFNVGIEYRDRNSTNRAAAGGLFFENASPENLAILGRVNWSAGDGESEDLWLTYNGAYEFSDTVEGYSFGRVNQREAQGSGFFRYPDSSANVLSIFPEGYLPITTTESDDLSLTFGVRGESSWDWDLSMTYGVNEIDLGLARSVNASFGAASPTTFHLAGFERDQLTFNGDIVRELDWGVSGPVTLAFGAEYRTENFETTAGDPASYEDGGQGGNVGAEAGPGLAPESTVDVDRDVYGFYGDISVPVTDSFTIGFAGRYEDYDDFGDALTGKLTGFLQVNDAVSFRAAVSNSFRAPALSQLGFEFTTLNFGDGGMLVPVGQVSVDNPVAIANGAIALKEEESVNVSAGIVITPSDNFSITLDAFQVDIDDRLGLRQVSSANITYFANQADTETEGLDIVTTYSTEWLSGSLDISFAATFADTTVKNPAGLGEEDLNILETISPDQKFILSGIWSNDRWNAVLRLTQFGEATRDFDFGGGFPDPQDFGKELSVDTEVSFKATDGWVLAIGADNLLDEYSDRVSPNFDADGNLPYDIVSPIGTNGRYLYIRTSYDF